MPSLVKMGRDEFFGYEGLVFRNPGFLERLFHNLPDYIIKSSQLQFFGQNTVRNHQNAGRLSGILFPILTSQHMRKPKIDIP
jgi:hypothetical protein